ncbi:hypothetical protein ACWEQL_22910 [Kitasatospora sp. NPDC004240]
MLVETVTAVAAAGGAGVVQAAGTDTWTALRARVARLLGRGRPETERAVLERLDRTGEALTATGPDIAAQVSSQQEASWRTRFEDFLDTLGPAEQAVAVEELRALLAEAGSPAPPPAVHAENSGVTVGGSLSNHGGVIGRDFTAAVTIGGTDRPTPPGPDQR